MRTLTLVAAGSGLPDREELLRRERADEMPRASLYADTLGSDMLDERFLAAVPRARARVYRGIPTPAAQVMEAFIRMTGYDAVISWSEHLGIPLAGLLKATGRRPVHVGLFSWISKPKKAMLLRRVHSRFDRIILWSSVQRDFAVNTLGIPASRIAFTRYHVDQKFWRPLGGAPAEMICAAGREMRDYATLIEALRGTGIRGHIAAQPYPGKHDGWMSDLSSGELPPNVTVGARSPADLRRLYNSSRFTVIPLMETDTDNGVTCILESMAAGKPVICSRTKGQCDVVRDGETGLYVTPGDPRALREAITFLWNHPQEAERMGRQARAYIERFHTFDWWTAEVRSIVEDAVQEHRRALLSKRPAAHRKAQPSLNTRGGSAA